MEYLRTSDGSLRSEKVAKRDRTWLICKQSVFHQERDAHSDGELDVAQVLFDGMDKKDDVCWNVMIDSYIQNGVPNGALVLFRRMLKAKAKPNEATMLPVWVHSYNENNGIQFNVHIRMALAVMYSTLDNLEDVCLGFDKSDDKDVVWNSMIVGYAMLRM
ncbi:hypothetical protein AAG906_031200 [Vitis piasezkii]